MILSCPTHSQQQPEADLDFDSALLPALDLMFPIIVAVLAIGDLPTALAVAYIGENPEKGKDRSPNNEYS